MKLDIKNLSKIKYIYENIVTYNRGLNNFNVSCIRRKVIYIDKGYCYYKLNGCDGLCKIRLTDLKEQVDSIQITLDVNKRYSEYKNFKFYKFYTINPYNDIKSLIFFGTIRSLKPLIESVMNQMSDNQIKLEQVRSKIKKLNDEIEEARSTLDTFSGLQTKYAIQLNKLQTLQSVINGEIDNDH